MSSPQLLPSLTVSSTLKVADFPQTKVLPVSQSLPPNPLRSTNDCHPDSITISSKDKVDILALLQTLKKDGLIRSRRAKARFSFENEAVMVNKRKIPDHLQGKYLGVLRQWGIIPCNQLQLKFFTRGVDIRYRYSAKGGQVKSNVDISIRF